MSATSFKNVLCCLDRSAVDENVLIFANQLRESGLIQNIKALHVVDSELEEKARQYTDNDAWNDFKEEIRKDIRKNIKTIFKNSDNIKVIVRGGSPLEVINTKSKSEAVDLVIVGNKKKKNGLGIAGHHIARSALCDILFVPEGYQNIPQSILCAYDFSEHSEATMNVGLSFAKTFGIKDFKALNILASPSGYFKTGRLHKDFVESEKKNLSKKWNKEVELHPRYENVDFDITENEKNDVSHYVKLKGSEMNEPIIFIGSKGKTASSSFLLGSVTEKVLMKEIESPIWIHKMPGENFDLFDAIFKGD
ncbi:universal stress protein [Hyphobacterium sp. CCMP332]|nr:universal stress protein [Hyphobacterium sp. CCMP332]